MRLRSWVSAFPLFLACLAPAQGELQRTDTQKEIEIGREMYEYAIRRNGLSTNQAYWSRVNRITAQLISALPEKLYPYQTVIMGDNVVNAGCWPGGYIEVDEGLLTWMPDDCELAFTIAHEMGHASRRHWARQIRKEQSDRAFGAIMAAITHTPMNERALVLKSIAHTRDHEREADEFGTELYLRAGFDPSKVTAGMEALKNWEKRVGGRRPPEYLNDHPGVESRIYDIAKTADKLIKAGLRPVDPGKAPDLSIESVFGKIPTLATKPCPWQAMEPGTIWNYEVRSGGTRSRYSVQAVGLSEVAGSSVARMRMDIGGHSVFYQLIADDDRVWRRNRPEDAQSTWAVETAFPEAEGICEAGKWTFKNAGSEKVETPAGSFDGCIKISATDSSGRTLTLWFAPNVGLVRRLNEKTGVDEVLVSLKRP